MERSLPPLLGVLINLALSLVLLNWLTCQQEVTMGLLLSITFFCVSTSSLIALYRAKKLRNKQQSAPEPSAAERSLKEQLRGCLQYGDTEQADQISMRLMALKPTSEANSDGFSLGGMRQLLTQPAKTGADIGSLKMVGKVASSSVSATHQQHYRYQRKVYGGIMAELWLNYGGVAVAAQ